MTDRRTILVVEDDDAMRELLDDELTEAGYSVVLAAEGREALDQFGRHAVDAVVTDMQMPGMKGRELLDELRRRDPAIPVIIITAFGTIDGAVDAIKAGAWHFIPKPFHIEDLIATLDEALAEKAQSRRFNELRETARTSGIVVECAAMRKTMDLVDRAAPVDTPVLLLGESGTGKELLARSLHTQNAARRGRFIAVNCSAIPENLLESQLFGHRRGAFTDAREDRPGLFQDAENGTLFLDEVGDMPLPLQGKLLRVLQEKEVHPLGASTPVPIDVRVIAATHRNLEASVREGQFRQDLYYRLNVIVIRVPPLRERRDDLMPLIAHFLKKHGDRLGRPGCSLSPGALEALMSYSWPGNVRELENAIERSLVLGREDLIRLDDLPESILDAPPEPGPGATDGRSVAHVERDHILKTLRAVAGNKAAAARLLGLDRKTLYRKLKAYRIEN